MLVLSYKISNVNKKPMTTTTTNAGLLQCLGYFLLNKWIKAWQLQCLDFHQTRHYQLKEHGMPRKVNFAWWDALKNVIIRFHCTFLVLSPSKQRSAVFGSISRFRNEGDYTHVPIIFELETPAIDLFFYNHPQYTKSYLSYKYSKIELANAFRDRNHFLGFFTDFKKLLLTYPALPVPDGNHDMFSHLSALSSELNILAPCIQDTEIFFVKIEVVSLGPLLGQYHSWLEGGDSFSIKSRDEIISNSELLNVSLSLRFTESRLSFTEKYYKNISKLTMEGLYDPSNGEMHLVGCRKILAKPAENSDTERGYDWKVLYSAKTMKWLINPTAKITITSQRKNCDIR